MADDAGFLLKCTDEAVTIVQSLVTLLSLYYESTMTAADSGPGLSLGALNMDSVELTYHLLSELLAKLWPCEKKFVAVIGPTGCGKSTILNILTAMTCRTGDAYLQGINQDESRAALRETARHHGATAGGAGEWQTNAGDGSHVGAGGGTETEVASGSHGDPDSTSVISEEEKPSRDVEEIVHLDTDAEKQSICGLLGICCARNREAYLSKHLAFYDKNPFLLLNGRMGDAGTTKVTAVQWGPKFIAQIQWVEKRKLRKRWRLLRQFLDGQHSADSSSGHIEEKEHKELWQCMLSVVGHDTKVDQLPTPTEELIESTLDKLAKKIAFGKKEVLEIAVTQGSVADRLYVRDGLRKRLCEERLGLLSEELIIEAPIPSSEGGVCLLDVPGTNDPRLLHQRETRDAIDRTALILLILDKSLLDGGTEKVLEDSPVLERMLLEDSALCSLVVVGVAEKAFKGGQPMADMVANFDPKQDLRKALRSIFVKKARNLVRARRLTKEEALQRVNSIFDGNRFCVLPVLPLLCASLHLSASNPSFHRQFCESAGEKTCPLSLSKDERMRRCLETNVPQLLERIQSVRMPPKRSQLRSQLQSAIEMLKIATQESTYDADMLEFLKRERRHCRQVASETFAVETLIPDEAINLDRLRKILDACAEDCRLSPEDVTFVLLKAGTMDALKAANSAKQHVELGPVLLRGFRPEIIGKITQEIMKPTEEKSAVFVNSIYQHMVSRLNGDPSWRDATIDKMMNSDNLGCCVALIEEVKVRWRHTLDRILAGCTCGGPTGGLQKQVRGALRKAYDGSMKTILKQLRKEVNDRGSRNLGSYLEENEGSRRVKDHAFIDIEARMNDFWSSLIETYAKEIPLMLSRWQKQLELLIRSTKKALQRNVPDVPNDGDNLKKSIQAKLAELEALEMRLDLEWNPDDATVNYGYSLLQNNPCFEEDFTKFVLKRPPITTRREGLDLIPDYPPNLTNLGEQMNGSLYQANAEPSSSRGVQNRDDHKAAHSDASLPLPTTLPTVSNQNLGVSQTNFSNPGQRRNVVPLSIEEAHNLQLRDFLPMKKKRK